MIKTLLSYPNSCKFSLNLHKTYMHMYVYASMYNVHMNVWDLHIILVRYTYAKGLQNIFCLSLWGQNWMSRPNPHSSVVDKSANWLWIWNGFCGEILLHFHSLTKFHFNLASSKELILLLYVENQMEKSILSLVCLISFDWNGWLHQ